MTIWVGTSWKMNKIRGEAQDYTQALALADPSQWAGIQAFIIPPLTALSTVSNALGEDSPILLGVQNAHWEDAGAWTGEVSMLQVADAGAQIVEIGHSERREHFSETDLTVNLKVKAALRHGLRPLVCVGEPADVFDAGESVPHVLSQVEAALEGIEDASSVLIAYEPIWAIGEHGRPSEPEDIADVFRALDSAFTEQVEGLLYGGSVNASNAGPTLAVPGVKGLFIGRSAWTAAGYLEILHLVTAEFGDL